MRILFTIDALLCIFKEEGVRGLYRGIVPSLLLTLNGALQVFNTRCSMDYYFSFLLSTFN